MFLLFLHVLGTEFQGYHAELATAYYGWQLELRPCDKVVVATLQCDISERLAVCFVYVLEV